MLLGAVVDVALQPAALRLLGLDDPCTRALELEGSRLELTASTEQLNLQAQQPQHEPGLGGEIGEQPLLDDGERNTRTFLQPKRTKLFVAVADRRGPQSVHRDWRRASRSGRGWCAVDVEVHRPPSRQGHAARHLKPNLSPARARALG